MIRWREESLEATTRKIRRRDGGGRGDGEEDSAAGRGGRGDGEEDFGQGGGRGDGSSDRGDGAKGAAEGTGPSGRRWR
jgi:UPF0755 protein